MNRTISSDDQLLNRPTDKSVDERQLPRKSSNLSSRAIENAKLGCADHEGYVKVEDDVANEGRDVPEVAVVVAGVGRGRVSREQDSAYPGCAARSGANCLYPYRDQDSIENIFSYEPTQNLDDTKKCSVIV